MIWKVLPGVDLAEGQLLKSCSMIREGLILLYHDRILLLQSNFTVRVTRGSVIIFPPCVTSAYVCGSSLGACLPVEVTVGGSLSPVLYLLFTFRLEIIAQSFLQLPWLQI